MPLPDATKDTRIYQLLKNIDLGNLTFEEFQTAAQTVFAEPEAEDTLRRIVLVNLARMSVAGDWEGLTTAASGGGGISLPTIGTTSENQYLISNSPIWGTTNTGTSISFTSASLGKCIAFPFISPISGTVDELSIMVSAAGAGETTMYAGIYSENDAKLPGTLLGYATMNTTSTGQNLQTSFSASITLVAGTTYWYSLNMGGAGTSTQLQGSSHNDTPNVGIGSSITETGVAVLDNNMTAYAVPPSTFQASYVYSGFGRPLMSISFP
jgi:hypothetical protein